MSRRLRMLAVLGLMFWAGYESAAPSLEWSALAVRTFGTACAVATLCAFVAHRRRQWAFDRELQEDREKQLGAALRELARLKRGKRARA